MSGSTLDFGFDVGTELNEARLENALQAVMERNDLLIKENEILAAHLFRHKADDNVELPTRPLSLQERFDTILQEEAAIKADISDLTDNANRDIESLKEVLEESTIRCNETKKDAYELRRDLMANSEATKIPAEKLIKYLQEKLQSKQVQCDKLQTKNASLKLAIQKCELQLRQKSEQGENLHQIDFEQLQIENSQYNAKIEQRNKQLLKLKMTTGKTVQVLNNTKHELTTLLNENSKLKKDIGEREAQIKKLADELDRVAADISKANRIRIPRSLANSKPDTVALLRAVTVRNNVL